MTATFVPVAFSKPIAMPWHHAVLGELQYRLSCAAAAHGSASSARARKPRRTIGRVSSSLGDAADFLVPALEQALAFGRRSVLREVVVDELDIGDLRRQRGDRRPD